MIRRLFSLNPGEGKSLSLFALVAFLCALASNGGVILADGLLIENVGADGIALSYFVVSLSMFCSATLFLWLLKRFHIRQIFIGMIGINICAFAVLGLINVVCETPPPAYWYALDIVLEQLFLLMWTGIWTFVDQSYDLQDAKRVFGLISAAYTLGAAAGGALVAGLINQIHIEGMLISLGGAYIVAMVLSLWVKKAAPTLSEAGLAADDSQPVSPRELIRHVAKCRYSLYILLMGILVPLTYVIVEYNYMGALEHVFGSETSNEVTRFIGINRSWVCVANVVFGSLLYGRFIKKIGLNNAWMVPAFSYMLFFVAMPPIGGLALAVVGIIIVEGVIPSVEDNTLNLLLKATNRRMQIHIRVISEHYFEPTGFLISSTLLMLLAGHSALLGLIASVLTLFVAIGVRTSYKRALRERLHESLSSPLPELESISAPACSKRLRRLIEIEVALARLEPTEKLLESIVQLVCLASAQDNPSLLFHTLRSSDEKTHSHALETLERSCPRDLYHLIYPLFAEAQRLEVA